MEIINEQKMYTPFFAAATLQPRRATAPGRVIFSFFLLFLLYIIRSAFFFLLIKTNSLKKKKGKNCSFSLHYNNIDILDYRITLLYLMQNALAFYLSVNKLKAHLQLHVYN